MARARKIISEAKAWRLLAQWFAQDVTREYICNVLASAPKFVPASLRETMEDRVIEHRAIGTSPTLCTTDTDGSLWANPASQRTRVIFCLLMALECEDEARGA